VCCYYDHIIILSAYFYFKRANRVFAAMQEVWEDFLAKTEFSHQSIFTFVCFIISLVGYYAHGWFFVLADEYKFMEAYKIRSGKHRVPSQQLIWSAIKV
jgi:hypothetical protein